MTGAIGSLISLDSTVRFHPLSSQHENGVVIVGRGDQFLELPPEGLDFIKWLNEGLTVGRAREHFESLYEPFPDEHVLEVMKTFLECDFVAAVNGQAIASRHTPLQSDTHLIPRRWAQVLFSRPALIAWMLIVVPAAVLWVVTPDLWPQRRDYFWADYNSIVILTAMLIWLIGMMLHETSHWLACRSKEIDATITWTQRLGFFPMSQTVMHNIWAVPRRARFLPLAAGMAWDVFALSLALYLLYFEKTGWFVLPWQVIKLLKFYVLFITMALVSQFWLFSKMDGYFLVSALLGQRNLQSDTYNWLKSKIFKRNKFDVPVRGIKFVYIYAIITVIWGGLFMGQFLLVDLPIKIELIWGSFLRIWRYAGTGSIDLYDGAAVLTSQVIFYGLLLYAVGRERYSRWRQV